jgi:deoxyribodipyrimidine photo-lyase
MGRPYLEKYSEVVWEHHQVPRDSALEREGREDTDGEMFRRWKEGTTGVPIVDAAMRCIREMGWVHNRARMIVAMYLTKDLMIDWRVGERVCGYDCSDDEPSTSRPTVVFYGKPH